MGRFTGIPALSASGLDPAQARLLAALKENVELLTGSRGEAGGFSRAITRGQLNIRPLPEATYRNATAQGDGVNISGVNVVTLEDYRRALNDIQRLAQDVEVLRQYVAALANQLRG
jgi:hypothetical protein